jgi:hypothetical protein
MTVSLLDARHDQCRWILAEHGPDGLAVFCGELVLRRTSYCAEHHAIVWIGYQPPRRKPKPVMAIAA